MSTMGAAVNCAAEHDELRKFKYLVSKLSFLAQNQRRQCVNILSVSVKKMHPVGPSQKDWRARRVVEV